MKSFNTNDFTKDRRQHFLRTEKRCSEQRLKVASEQEPLLDDTVNKKRTLAVPLSTGNAQGDSIPSGNNGPRHNNKASATTTEAGTRPEPPTYRQLELVVTEIVEVFEAVEVIKVVLLSVHLLVLVKLVEIVETVFVEIVEVARLIIKVVVIDHETKRSDPRQAVVTRQSRAATHERRNLALQHRGILDVMGEHHGTAIVVGTDHPCQWLIQQK